MQAVMSESLQPVLSDRKRGAVPALAFSALLLLSGFCGISYEVLYGRILSNFVGDQFAVSASILLTFMLGIGCGALYAHRLWPWLWLIEGGIGAYAALLTLTIKHIESGFYAIPFLSHGLAGAMFVCFIVLLAPAFLIGCSLPLFAGYLGMLAPAGVFARAYTIYNFGAALTVLVIEFFLLRRFGIRNTILAMAVLNGMVSVLLLVSFRDLRKAPVAAVEKLIDLPWRHFFALSIASVASAVFQLLMVKTAECFLGPFRQTFALVLAVVLFGLAVGSAIARRWRLHFAHVMVVALVGVTWTLAGFEWITRAYASTHPLAAQGVFTAVLHRVVALGFLMGLPAIAFGAIIPALLGELGNVARNSGKLLCVSSLANAAGFLLMAFGLHRFLDYGVIIVTVALLVASSLVVYARFWSKWTLGAAALTALVLTLYPLRWNEQLLYLGYDSFQSAEDLKHARAHFKFPEHFKGVQDVFSLNHYDDELHFFINGYISIALNSPAEKIVGAFPALFAPRTDRALVLGVGSGSTAGTTGQLFDRVDAVEINPVVLQNLHRMSGHNFDIVSNPRVHFILDDGIHFTKLCQERYSLIINTVTAPIYFSSSKLYTVDFLREIRRCLSPEGIYVTWVDVRIGDRGLDIILKTIASTPFKHCALAGIKSGYYLLLCSDDPIRLRQPNLVTANPLVANYFRNNGVFPGFLPYGLLRSEALDLISNPAVPVNTLDYPALEFHMARLDDRYVGQWGTALYQKMGLSDVKTALEPAMKVDLFDLAWHTESLYEESSNLTARRLEVVEAEMEDFREKYLPKKVQYSKELAETAQTAQAHHDYGYQLMMQRRFAEAVEQEQKAVAIDPHFKNAYFNIALYYEGLERFDLAVQNYLRHRQTRPFDNRISLALGRVNYKQKNYLEALRFLERANSDKDRFENHLYLSLVLKELGRKEEGEREFQKAMNFGREQSQKAPASAFNRRKE